MSFKDPFKNKFHKKVATFGGGASHSSGLSGYGVNKSDSLRQKLYNAEYVIMSSRQGIEIYKNRWEGDIGFVSSEKFMEVMLRMLARKLYNGLTEVFQEGFITEAKKALERVLEEHSKVERIKD
jgi:hypothetical protein